MLIEVMWSYYVKSENTLMSEWGASDDSLIGTVWSEYIDGWEVRRVERWNGRWLFVRERQCLDRMHWTEHELATLVTRPEADACDASEFENAWECAWRHGLEDIGTHMHGDRAELLAIDPDQSPHRRNV